MTPWTVGLAIRYRDRGVSLGGRNQKAVFVLARQASAREEGRRAELIHRGERTEPLGEPVQFDHDRVSFGGAGRAGPTRRPTRPMLRYMMPPSGIWIRQMSAHTDLRR